MANRGYANSAMVYSHEGEFGNVVCEGNVFTLR